MRRVTLQNYEKITLKLKSMLKSMLKYEFLTELTKILFMFKSR